MAQELKAFGIRGEENGRLYFAEVYTKRDVDAVLEAKDAKILHLEAEVMTQKHHAKLFFDERNYAESQVRHHMYKRCIKMAKWCISMMIFNSKYGTDKKWHHFKKWHNRWLKIAEKFKDKEAK